MMMWTELEAYLRRCDLTYADLAKLTGLSIEDVHKLGKTIPVPRSLSVLLRLFDYNTYTMKSRDEKLSFLKTVWVEHMLEPNEILNVERDDIAAGSASKSELVLFYAAQGNEKAVRRAANAFEDMCVFAKIFEDEKLS